MTTRPCLEYLSCISTRCGKAFLQGSQNSPQKSTSTTLPRCLTTASFRPSYLMTFRSRGVFFSWEPPGPSQSRVPRQESQQTERMSNLPLEFTLQCGSRLKAELQRHPPTDRYGSASLHFRQESLAANAVEGALEAAASRLAGAHDLRCEGQSLGRQSFTQGLRRHAILIGE